MTKQEQAEMYRSYLAEEGYVPKVDESGDVVFKVEGQTYVILIDDEDDSFFRLAFPAFWEIESEEERRTVERAAAYVCMNTKVVKVYPMGDDTWATIEAFCEPPETFKAIFPRAIGALRSGAQAFREKMFELRKPLEAVMHAEQQND